MEATLTASVTHSTVDLCPETIVQEVEYRPGKRSASKKKHSISRSPSMTGSPSYDKKPIREAKALLDDFRA